MSHNKKPTKQKRNKQKNPPENNKCITTLQKKIINLQKQYQDQSKSFLIITETDPQPN